MSIIDILVLSFAQFLAHSQNLLKFDLLTLSPLLVISCWFLLLLAYAEFSSSWSPGQNSLVLVQEVLPDKKARIPPVWHHSDSSRGNPGALMRRSIFCLIPWNFCTITLKLTFEPLFSSWCSACSWCALWLYYVSRHFGSLPLAESPCDSKSRRGSSATPDFSWHLTPLMKLEDKLMCHSSIDFSFASHCPLVPEPAQPLLHAPGWITGARPP